MFLISMLLLLYAIWHVLSGLLFGHRQPEAEVERPARSSASTSAYPGSRLPWPLRPIAWIGYAGIYWFSIPLWRVFVALLKLLFSLPRILWSGPEQVAPPAPVSTISVTLPRDYVTQIDSDLRQSRNAGGVAATDPSGRNAIAITDNERNSPLSRNIVARAQADIIARLLKSESLYIPDGRGGYKKVGQVVLIRMATGLEPNGRADSDYGQLKAELDPLLRPELIISNTRVIER